MELKEVINVYIQKGLELLPEKMNSQKAVVMLVAIGLQESRFKYTKQVGGPARGWWQFEKGGGVVGVMTHPRTKAPAQAVARALDLPFEKNTIYNALEVNQFLACAFARLLLWTDPHPLPEVGEVWQAWDCYTRNWRPGKPHSTTWEDLYITAVKAVGDHYVG